MTARDRVLFFLLSAAAVVVVVVGEPRVLLPYGDSRRRDISETIARIARISSFFLCAIPGSV